MNGLSRLIRMEARLMLREPALLPISLALPVGLLVIFGLSPSAREADPALGGFRGIDTVLPSMAVSISLAVLAFFTLPSVLGSYREKGILRRLSTTPANPAGLLIAQLLVNLMVSIASIVAVTAVGIGALDMRMPKNLPGAVAALVLGAAALFALGLLVASIGSSARAAQGIGTILFFPSMFFAGIYVPKENMPKMLARIGDFTPLGAFRQTLQDSWAGLAPDGLQLAFLGVLIVVLSAAATKLFRWQ